MVILFLDWMKYLDGETQKHLPLPLLLGNE